MTTTRIPPFHFWPSAVTLLYQTPQIELWKAFCISTASTSILPWLGVGRMLRYFLPNCPFTIINFDCCLTLEISHRPRLNRGTDIHRQSWASIAITNLLLLFVYVRPTQVGILLLFVYLLDFISTISITLRSHSYQTIFIYYISDPTRRPSGNCVALTKVSHLAADLVHKNDFWKAPTYHFVYPWRTTTSCQRTRRSYCYRKDKRNPPLLSLMPAKSPQ